jgi:hypothetical protein
MENKELLLKIGKLEAEKENTRKSVEKLASLMEENKNVNPDFISGFLKGILR